MKPIRKAVFPVAGMGTRFLPATKAMPKEMLPVVDRPLIQYAVEEAIAAGITDLIFVTGRTKRAIEDHFDRTPELEMELERKHKTKLLEVVCNVIPSNINCIYTRQSAPLGLGRPCLTATSFCNVPSSSLPTNVGYTSQRCKSGSLRRTNGDDPVMQARETVLALHDTPSRFGCAPSDGWPARSPRCPFLPHPATKPTGKRKPTMQALVYNGPGRKNLEERPKPAIKAPTDAIVKITRTTICGTDLHILKGDVATCQSGTILGHEGVGVVDTVGPGVTTFKPGDRVLISCITACGRCEFCRKGMYSHCTTGGWMLGNSIDGTQAEFVRIPHADTSLYPIPQGADEEALVMLSDILPTGFECGVLNGKVQVGSTVAVAGSGPIGLAALLTAQFYSPAEIIMIDLDENRLAVAKRFGATATVNSSTGDAAQQVMKLTGGRGVDTAIEAVGIPATFELCQDIVAPGGTIANVGVHGVKVDLHLERLWSNNVTITTGLVDTFSIPMLLKTVQSRRIDASQLITHRFKLDQILQAYDTFGQAANTKALKVIIEA